MTVSVFGPWGAFDCRDADKNFAFLDSAKTRRIGFTEITKKGSIKASNLLVG